MKKFFIYLKPYKFHVIISTFFVMTSAIFVGIAPYFEGLITTSISNSAINNIPVDFDYVIKMIILLFIFYLTVGISRLIYTLLLTKHIQEGIKTLRSDVQKKIHRLPISYFDDNQTGSTMGRLTIDIESI